MGSGEASAAPAGSSSAHAEEGEEEEEEEKEKESTAAAEMMATMRTNRKTKKKRQHESVCRSIVRILLPMPCLGMAGAGFLGDGNGNGGGGGSRVTGTLFGRRQGNVQFAVQEHPRSEPALLLELPILTSELVRDMASTCVRIALEAERKAAGQGGAGAAAALYEEPIWSVFCDGRQTSGFAVPRRPSPTHSHLLGLIQAVSMGAGVLPPPPLSLSKPTTEDTDNCSNDNEEVMYMRANFERVVASRDSEAFYMMNPDGSGSPELTIFLLRV